MQLTGMQSLHQCANFILVRKHVVIFLGFRGVENQSLICLLLSIINSIIMSVVVFNMSVNMYVFNKLLRP